MTQQTSTTADIVDTLCIYIVSKELSAFIELY